MDKLEAINVVEVERALSAGDADVISSLISGLQSRLDILLPVANQSFANLVTEAHDLGYGSSGMSLNDALRNISDIQAELQTILFGATPNDAFPAELLSLPTPEMLFSDPEHVPMFVDWKQYSQHSTECDLSWQHTGSLGISSNIGLNGRLDDQDRFDA